MNNKIEWNKYVDHIFCLQYLQNNRLKEISKTLINIGIDIYDSRYFSFVYVFFSLDVFLFWNYIFFLIRFV